MEEKSIERKSCYERWLEQEGLPVIQDFYIEDVRKVPLERWERKGGFGVYLNLIGTGNINDAYICEIPPGKSLKPERHLIEEMIYVATGRGATTIWQDGGKKQTFEWQEGSLFSPPLNTWRQHFNGSGDTPARLLAVTSAPVVMNLFHNLEFVFNTPFSFSDRYDSQEGYFSGKGESYSKRVWETNFVPDVRGFPLKEWRERGAGGKNIMFELSDNTMAAHISEFPVGTYKKAHRHGPGAHVIIIAGKGYSLMWPEGSPMQRFDWQEGSIIVPPERWFHQHFNAGATPARYLALRWGSKKNRFLKQFKVDESVKAGGDQIEYEDEDPVVRQMFEEALRKVGIESRMGAYHHQKQAVSA
ncbi:MAG: cupin domain-containing protein [Candidatus Binatia bacterium]